MFDFSDSVANDRARVTMPPGAKKKIAALRKAFAAHKARGSVEQAAKENHVNSLRSQRDDLQYRVSHLEKSKQHGHVWEDRNEAELKSLSEELASTVAELQEITAQKKPVVKLPPAESRRLALRAELFEPLDYWLRKLPSTARFLDAPAAISGKVSLKMLAENRAEEDSILDAIHENRRLPRDLESVLADMRRDVAKLAERGKPSVADLLRVTPQGNVGRRRAGEIKWPFETAFTPTLSDSGRIENGVSFATWLFREQVESKLEAMIRESMRGEGISDIERAAEEEALIARLIEVQRTGERIFCSLENAGERRFISPLALLEIEQGESVTPKARVGFHEIPRGSAESPIVN